MVNEHCNKCNKVLVQGEENPCSKCILVSENGDENTLDVNCGICKVIVEEDSEGLFCDVCNSWFHNYCNKTPLDYELYALLNDAPKNVKWFCDKCIWETDKWIKDVNNKQYNTSKDNDKVHAQLKSEECNDSLDLDECDPIEDSEEFIILQQKKKRMKKPNAQSIYDNIRTSSDTIATENILNLLDISPEKLSNISKEILSVKKTKHIRSKCNLCSKAFIHLEDCIAHILSFHEGVLKPYRCSVCKTVWETKKALHKHIRIHTIHKSLLQNNNVHQFKDKQFPDIKDSSHVTIKSKVSQGFGDSYKENNAEFVRVNNSIESDDDYIEDGVQYADSSDSEGSDYNPNPRKKYQCSGEKTFQCSHCKKTFAYYKGLTRHMKTHSLENPYQCRYCEKTFKIKTTLKSHLSTHTRDKPFQCIHCDKAFIHNTLLMRHIRTHTARDTGDKPYLCNHCGKAFKKNCVLKRHLRTHTGEKPYICNYCGMAFSMNDRLKFHLRIHTGEKPFLCNQCGKVFTESKGLSRHLKTHTGEKPFKCNHCDDTFRRNDQLISHLRIHTGEKPYICSHCGQGYSHNCQLKTHLLKHNEGKT
ncbi:unnamed protein product [Meganyctiphanes norvegica]|uniref:Uncharacterized protein n=1 Tax=Meganyctiphanes norvegica TaxID=48144 RepID=A0AAV2QKQ4_MEGNR